LFTQSEKGEVSLWYALVVLAPVFYDFDRPVAAFVELLVAAILLGGYLLKSDFFVYVRCWRWPTVDGEVTSTRRDVIRTRNGTQSRVAVTYKFNVSEDGPYTGETFWDPLAGIMFHFDEYERAAQNVYVGRRVSVRYRPDDPSVNIATRLGELFKNSG
jgi:hypothetical protein